MKRHAGAIWKAALNNGTGTIDTQSGATKVRLEA